MADINVCTFTGGSGCPEADGGPHYYCLKDGAQCVDLDGDPICESCVAPDVVVCPACNGRGGQHVRWHNGLSYWQPCAVCDEKCVIPAQGGDT